MCDRESVLAVQKEKSTDIKFSECQQTIAVASDLGNSPHVEVHLFCLNHT